MIICISLFHVIIDMIDTLMVWTLNFLYFLFRTDSQFYYFFRKTIITFKMILLLQFQIFRRFNFLVLYFSYFIKPIHK
jgi:hypothetical protein